ncbi:SIMPL domain-containing protein [Streptomyces roseirectus]|uniref:SIMPL domain-containing protein n=1 Tax=Streptomyces roseirectus TaxID=2768066 RepID=A0A7H0I8E4_9ACTN|nr:SIMPL domain-containing protein [Streptomyces roseirectus]QNP69060.1 SIMPL domain-containing protein [Streptomyces roseirectus]
MNRSRRSRATAAFAVSLLALGLPAVAAPGAAALDGGYESAPVVARAEPAPTTVTVTGDGSATAEPDLAVVGVGVEATAKTAKEALAAQNKAADALLKAVAQQGIADKDVRTDSVSLSPVYDYQDGTSVLTGYRAAQSFVVKVREIGKTGAVLQAVTDATGDAGRINSVVFDLADREPLQRAARKAAFADARSKAEQYAALSGRTLGRLVTLSEGGTGYVTPAPPMAADMPPGGLGSVPLAPGEIKATSSVTAVYELD